MPDRQPLGRGAALRKAFPEGDVWRFAPRPGVRLMLWAAAIGAGVITVLTGIETHMPPWYTSIVAGFGLVAVLWITHEALSELEFTPDGLIQRGLFGRNQVPWSDVAHVYLVPFRLAGSPALHLLFFPALIGAGLGSERLLVNDVAVEGNWVVALASAVIAAGAVSLFRGAIVLGMRAARFGSEGRVAAFRDADGKLLAGIALWPNRTTQPALEGVLNYVGVPFSRREPGQRLVAAVPADRQAADEALPSHPSVADDERSSARDEETRA